MLKSQLSQTSNTTACFMNQVDHLVQKIVRSEK